jgi:hypothetical protein
MAYTQIKLTPLDPQNSQYAGYEFPAFLETFGVTYEIQENSIGFSPLSFPTDKIRTRMIQNLDMSVNVFSSNSDEAAINYGKLNNLLYALKPRYLNIGSQYIPSSDNLFGHLQVEFEGLPNIGSSFNKTIQISCNQFKYEINKDLGFVTTTTTNPTRLTPVGFKITIGGRIITSFEDGLIRLSEVGEEDNQQNSDNTPAQPTISSIIGEVNGTQEEFNKVLNNVFADLSSGKTLSELEPNFALALAEVVKQAIKTGDIKFNGEKDKWEPKSLLGGFSPPVSNAITAAENLKR